MSGLSLVELMVTISILSIIGFGVSHGITAISQKVQNLVAINSLGVALKYARSEAIARNEIVRICATRDGKTCSSPDQWESGWIIYLDVSGESSRTSVDLILQHQGALTGVKISKNGREKTLKFSESGTVGLNRSITICTKNRGYPVARLAIIHSGRMRLDKRNVECEPV